MAEPSAERSPTSPSAPAPSGSAGSSGSSGSSAARYDPPPPQAHQADVFAKLAELRIGIRRIVGLTGLNALVCGVFAFVAVSLAVDFGLCLLLGNLKPLYRMTLSGLGAAGLLIVLWRHLLSPLWVALPDDDLALRVERSYPGLADRVISAVQFARGAAARPGRTDSRELVDHVVGEAGRAAAGIDFAGPLDWAGLARRATAGVAAALILASAAVARADLMVAWFQRNVLFENVAYPGLDAPTARFDLAVDVAPRSAAVARKIDENTLGVLAGESLEVAVAARPRPGFDESDLPGRIHLRLPDGTTYELSRSAEGTFAHLLRNVSSPVTFRLSAHTDRSGEVSAGPVAVRVEAPAGLKDWKLIAYAPSYTRMAPRTFDFRDRDIALPAGGLLVLSGNASKPLAEVRLTLRPKEGAPAAEAGPATPSAANPAAPASAPAVPAGEDSRVRRQVKPVASSAEFDGELPVDDPGEMRLSLSVTDSDGYRAEDLINGLEIRVLPPDERPRVALWRPGTGDRITPSAMLRLEMRAEDDYGLLGRDLLGRPGTFLQFKFRAVGGDQTEAVALDLSDARTYRAEIPGLPDPSTAGPGGGPSRTLPPADESKYPGGRLRWLWTPSDFAKLTVGDKVDVWAVAKDTYRRPVANEVFRLAGFPATTDLPTDRSPEECRSEIARLTVVDPGDLLEALVRRQREQQRLLRAVLERQEDLAMQTSRWRDTLLRAGAESDPKVLEAIAARARQQEALAAQLTRISDTLAVVAAEMELNRVGRPADRVRLIDRVSLPLKSMAVGAGRVREIVAADPWTDAPERQRLTRDVIPSIERLLGGKGALMADIAADMDDLAAGKRPAAALRAAAGKVFDRQRLAAKLIRDALEQMQSGINGSLDEIVRLLRDRVIKPQEEILKDTEKREKSQVVDIFDK